MGNLAYSRLLFGIALVCPIQSPASDYLAGNRN